MTFDQIKDMLVEGVCQVTFTKVDGTERIMRCTIKEDLIPAEQFPVDRSKDPMKGSNGKPLTNVLAVWDLDKAGWRSFRLDHVSNVEKVVE